VNVIVSEKDLAAQHAEIVDYVGADNFTGGKQIGEQVLKDYGPNAKLVIGIVTEPNEIPTVERTKGFKSALAGNPNVKFVQEVNGLVNPDVSLLRVKLADTPKRKVLHRGHGGRKLAGSS
jgi:ribose transport system substrate-binding protein